MAATWSPNVEELESALDPAMTTPLIADKGDRPPRTAQKSLIYLGRMASHGSPRPDALLASGALPPPSPQQVGFLRSLVQQLPSALVTLITTAIYSVTYGNLVFAGFASGRDSPPLPSGVNVWLLASGMSQVPMLLMSRVPFAVGNGALEMLPIVHQISRSIQHAMASATPEEVAATSIATVFVSTLCLGVLLTIGGRLGCSRWLRCVPVVVLKGALFGVAIFLLKAAFDSTVIQPKPGVDGLLDQWERWGPAVALGTTIFVLDEVIHSPVAIVTFLLCVAAAPQASQLLGGPSVVELADAGFLLGGAEGAPGEPWYRELPAAYVARLLPRVSWSVVFLQMPAMCGLWLTHILCTLMDLKAIELLTQTEVNLDTELATIGIGNILSALGGSGWPVYMLCSQTVTAAKLGGTSRIVGLLKLLSIVPLLACVREVVPRLPRALPGCVAWWLGLSFFKETAVDILMQHSHGFDVFIVISMALVMTSAGMLEGLQVGFLMALVAFTWRYSSLAPVVRSGDDATFLHSNNSRPNKQYALLDQFGHRIRVFYLEGYVMFGSSPQLVDAVRPLLEPGGPSWVVLNFRGVRGLDYSATCDLAALGRRAAQCGCSLVATELKGAVQDAIRRARLTIPELVPALGQSIPHGLSWVDHYNLAMKVCEDALLRSLEESPAPICSLDKPILDPAIQMLSDCLGEFLDGDVELLKGLCQVFDQEVFLPGHVLWRAHEHATFCVGVVEGCLHSLQPQGSTGDGHVIMEVVNTGAFVGFTGLLNQLTYSQTVVVPSDGEPCHAVVLRSQGVSNLVEHKPRQAIALFRALLRRQAFEFRVLSRLAAQL